MPESFIDRYHSSSSLFLNFCGERKHHEDFCLVVLTPRGSCRPVYEMKENKGQGRFIYVHDIRKNVKGNSKIEVLMMMVMVAQGIVTPACDLCSPPGRRLIGICKQISQF